MFPVPVRDASVFVGRIIGILTPPTSRYVLSKWLFFNMADCFNYSGVWSTIVMLMGLDKHLEHARNKFVKK